MKVPEAKSRVEGRASNNLRPARQFRWTKEEDALLGTMPDERLAKKLSRSVEAVRSRRHEKRISLRRTWRPEDDRLLGTRPDSQIARLVKWTTSSVSERRRRLGIPSFDEQRRSSLTKKLAAMSDQKIARLLRRSHQLDHRQPASRRKSAPKWTAAEDRLLGKWPDERVARFLGRPVKGVQSRRLKLGIRFASPAPRWKPEEERLLDPTAAPGPIRKWTGELSRRLGRSVAAIRNHRRLKYGPVSPPGRRWTRRELRLLGTRPDLEVARLVGRRCGNVQVKRGLLDIPSSRARQKFRWTPAKDRLLGTQDDRDLAERFGCSYAVLKQRRQKLGVAGFGNRPWTKEEERLVGTMRDEEVARLTGRSRKAVKHRRRALNLPQPKAGIRQTTHAP